MVAVSIILCVVFFCFSGFDDKLPDVPVPASMYLSPTPEYVVYNNTRNEDGSLTVVAISDLRDLYRSSELIKIPPADLLIFAGDATVDDDLGAEYFQIWLDSLAVKHKVLVYGNEDQLPYMTHSLSTLDHPLKRAFILVDETKEIMGFRVFGSPYSIYPGAYPLLGHSEAERHWQKVLPPDADIDIIVTHEPPYGFGDGAPHKGHHGDKALLKAVQNLKKRPLLWVCGHFAEGHGVYRVPHPPSGGEILLINAAAHQLRAGVESSRPRMIRLPDLEVTQPTDAEVLDMLGDRYKRWKGPFDGINDNP